MEYAHCFRTEEIFLKDAKGMLNVTGREIHPFDELFLFVDGEADFISDAGRERLAPMTAVVIPRGSFHQFVQLGPQSDYTRVVLNFSSVAELDELIALRMRSVCLTRDEETIRCFLQLRPLSQLPDTLENRIRLKALFAQLLLSLPFEPVHNPTGKPFAAITHSAIKYVAQHPGQRISQTELAAALHVSPSHLAHTFRQDMHIPLGRYMLHKRLILAHQKISHAVSPTQAAWECGFQDYSGFYRQYLRMFGTPPSAGKRG